MVTGEPFHDVISLRRAVATTDCKDLIFDHMDMIARLSAPLSPCTSVEGLVVSKGEDVLLELTPAAERLLKTAVGMLASDFEARLKSDRPAAALLESLLQHSRVGCAPVWKTLFGALPPRGTLSRIARRCVATLAFGYGMYNYPRRKHFKDEILLIKDWYRHSKKQRRRRSGIIRSSTQLEYVDIVQTAMTKKVLDHYRRLNLWLKVCGLWRWRRVALSLREAGIAMQTGTVSVERYWASALSQFPSSSRSLSEESFELYANLSYMRYNCRHFNHAGLPSWCRNDTLVGEILTHCRQWAGL